MSTGASWPKKTGPSWPYGEFAPKRKIHLIYYFSGNRSMRTYKRKTERGKTPKGVMLEAVSAVVKGKQSVRKTALDFNIPRKTLSRYVNKFIENGGSEGNVPEEEIEVGYAKYWQVYRDGKFF